MDLLYYLFREDSSKLRNLQKNLLKVFNKFTDVFTCKSRNFQTDYENELFFLQYYHKVRHFTNKIVVLK